MNIDRSKKFDTISMSQSDTRTAVDLLMEIVEMACEHEPDLELMRLVNFMDLYRTYLSHTISSTDTAAASLTASITDANLLGPQSVPMSECASFEQFIGDSCLLQFAAAAASRDTGIQVAIPAPLKLSANGPILQN